MFSSVCWKFVHFIISRLGDRFQAPTSPLVLCLALGASAEQAATEKITRASEQFEAQPGDSGGVCLLSDLIEFFRRKQNTVKTSNSACVWLCWRAMKKNWKKRSARCSTNLLDFSITFFQFTAIWWRDWYCRIPERILLHRRFPSEVALHSPSWRDEPLQHGRWKSVPGLKTLL